MKLLWLADRLHLMKYGRQTLNVNYVAMAHGPVPSQVMNLTRNPNVPYAQDYIVASGHYVNSQKELDDSCFTKSEINVYETVWRTYGHLGQFQLRDLSHEYPEWKRYQEVEHVNTSIPMNMTDFFEKPASATAKADLFNEIDEETLECSRLLYEDSVAIDKAHRELDMDRERRKAERALRTLENSPVIH